MYIIIIIIIGNMQSRRFNLDELELAREFGKSIFDVQLHMAIGLALSSGRHNSQTFDFEKDRTTKRIVSRETHDRRFVKPCHLSTTLANSIFVLVTLSYLKP